MSADINNFYIELSEGSGISEDRIFGVSIFTFNQRLGAYGPVIIDGNNAGKIFNTYKKALTFYKSVHKSITETNNI